MKPAGTAYVSLLVPSLGRTMWWALARCPACGRPACRAKTLPGVTGRRRLGCGHVVDVIVARSYDRSDTASGAAQ